MRGNFTRIATCVHIFRQIVVTQAEPASTHATTTEEKPRHGTFMDPTDIPTSHAVSSAERSETQSSASSDRSSTEFLVINDNMLEVIDIHELKSVRIPCMADFVTWPTHKTLPCLESLELISQTDRSDFSMTSLFCGALPNLKILKLVGLHRPWEPRAYVNLTTLHITTLSEPPEEQDLMFIFRNSPSLEEIKLVIKPSSPRASVYHRFMEKRSSNQDRYILPLLQNVELEVPCWYAYHILSGVDLPAIRRLKVATPKIRPAKIEPLEPMPTDFINKVCVPNRLTKSCKLVNVNPTGFTMSGDDMWFSVSPSSASRYSDSVLLSMFSAICTLDLPQLDGLELFDLGYCSSESYLSETLVPCLRSLLHGSTQLRTIKLRDVPSGFISALAHIPKPSALRELFLVDLRCKARDLVFLAMGHDWSVFSCLEVIFQADTLSIRAQLSCLSKAATSRGFRLSGRSFGASNDRVSIVLGDALLNQLSDPTLNAKDDPFILPRRVLDGFDAIRFTYTSTASGRLRVTVSGSLWNGARAPVKLDELLFKLEGRGFDTEDIIGPTVELLDALELSGVHSLDIKVSCGDTVHTTRWNIIDILSKFPALINLNLEGDTVFLDILASQCEVYQTTLFPHLQTITFFEPTVRLPTIISLCNRLLVTQEACPRRCPWPLHIIDVLRQSTKHVIAQKPKSTITGQCSEQVQDAARKPVPASPSLKFVNIIHCAVLIPEASPSLAGIMYMDFRRRMRAQNIRVYTGCGTLLEDVYGKNVGYANKGFSLFYVRYIRRH